MICLRPTNCDKIAIMNAGKISIIGPPEQLKKSVGGDIITITLSKQSSPDLSQTISIPAALGSVVSNDGITLKIVCENGEHTIPRLMEYFEKNFISVDMISLSKPTLEDAFMKYAGASLDSESAGNYRETRATRRSFARRSG